MLISLHKNATTTPAIRLALQQSSAVGYDAATGAASTLTNSTWKATKYKYQFNREENLSLQNKL